MTGVRKPHSKRHLVLRRRPHLKCIVEAECSGGQASFKVTTEGNGWPRLGEINIHFLGTKGPLAKRHLRISGAQQMTFRTPRNKPQVIAGGGIFIDPSWFSRKC